MNLCSNASLPPPFARGADAVAIMAHRLKTRTDRADYGLRKQADESVFGIIKHGINSVRFWCASLRVRTTNEHPHVRIKHQSNEFTENDRTTECVSLHIQFTQRRLFLSPADLK